MRSFTSSVPMGSDTSTSTCSSQAKQRIASGCVPLLLPLLLLVVAGDAQQQVLAGMTLVGSPYTAHTAHTAQYTVTAVMAVTDSVNPVPTNVDKSQQRALNGSPPHKHGTSSTQTPPLTYAH